jgi:hypothetical protein
MQKWILILMTATIAAAFVAPAHAACKKGEDLRTNTQGQPQCVNAARTFQDCVRNGMQLGYGRDSAERYCRPKFPQ